MAENAWVYMPDEHSLTTSWPFTKGCGRFRPALSAAPVLVAILCAPLSANAAVLWQRPESTRVQNNSVDVLHDALPACDDAVRETLYFKVRVNPLSDALIKTKANGSFQAGLVFRREGRQKLGVGNAWFAPGYSAYCGSFNFPGDKPGELTLLTDRPEAGAKGAYLAPRRDVPKTLLIKVEFVPGADDVVTIWLNPDLGADATEASQSAQAVTRFKTDMSFDEIRLMHRGAGEGWVFEDLAVATSFEDFVPKPVWQRPWFLFLVGGALVTLSLGGAIAVERRRARRKLAIVEREQAVTAERVRIARDIHDEMGAALTHIMMLSTLARQATDPETELERIHTTSRELTRAMDEIVWAVDPRHDTLESLVNYLGLTAQENLRAAGLSCELDIPLEIPQVQITSRIRHNLYLAFKEALANVIKHAEATAVVFRLKLTDKEFGFTLEDNGKGLAPEAESERGKTVSADRISSGNGLRNIKIRSQEAGGRTEIESQPGQGMRLTLWIPFPPQS